jgi:RNA polymerase sigma-54 factor
MASLWPATAPESSHELGEILISALDDDGYLSADIFELAEDLDVPLAHVQEALEYVQQLSPSGVGARSLGECLRLQLQAKQEVGESIPEEVGQIVEHFASCYERNIEKQLTETTELTTDQVRDALEYIRCNLHPYPGRQFRTAPSQHSGEQYIYPDAIIYYDGEDLRVKIPQSQTRELRINYAYLRLERIMKHRDDGANSDSELSDLDTEQICSIHEQIRGARRFIEMLQQRQITMKLVTEAILEQQRELFAHGIMALKPLTKKEIALKTGLHESTISRATRDKYVMMPSRTLLPFSIFFQDALPVKALIAQIVQQEESDDSLTDKQLAERLGQCGYPLARRTITKYRKQMGMPSSRQRDGSFNLPPAELMV